MTTSAPASASACEMESTPRNFSTMRPPCRQTFSTSNGAPLMNTRVSRSGNAVNGIADNSPLLPRGRTSSATVTTSAFRLFEDLESKTPIQLHTGGAQKRPDGTCCSALLSNDFTKIARRNAQLEDGDLLAFDFSNANLIRNVHKSFGNLFDKFTQCSAPDFQCTARKNLFPLCYAAGSVAGAGAGCCFRRRLTVSDGCAPLFIQYWMRSCFRFTTGGCETGL